jgi:plastocyanin
MTRSGWAIAALAVAALAVGCGDDDGGGSDTGSGGKATPAETTPAEGAATVKMQSIQFDPKEITVKVGEKITWTNEDSVDHDVVADSGASFRSDVFGKGGTFEFTPTKAGEITYECTLHPGMDGTIQVTK